MHRKRSTVRSPHAALPCDCSCDVGIRTPRTSPIRCGSRARPGGWFTSTQPGTSSACCRARTERAGYSTDPRVASSSPFRRPPPVNHLWSLSVLYPDTWRGPPCRNSLGWRPETLRCGPDGSLTIHIQWGSSDESRPPNWLPAPSAQFHLILRLLGPEDAFFDGSYTLPPVVRVAPKRRRGPPVR